ncbi:hypothetical protein SCA6_002551 [Theobroma cacao]
MDFVVGVVSSIVKAAAAYTTSTIKNHFKYLCNDENQWPSSRSKGITAGVYLPIELSYNYLEDEEVKIPFLLCSLIGHNGSVECLLSYIMGLGSFCGINTIKEARNKVLTVVSKLKASCLLLDSYNDEQFDIHDVVRDVAISIASRDHHMFVLRDGDVLKEWPDQERMKNCSVIFLSSPNISELPDELECSHLSFFFMNNEGSVHIPANFFRGTERLKVLHLARMQFQSLPVSINLLTNLHTLRLNRCSFGKLEEMIVECCDELLALFPSNVFGVLQSLKTLIVGRCDSLEQMFEVGVAVLNNKETHAVDSQLMKLYIYNLPKLKHVWNKDPQGSLTFQNLRKVGVRSCESLKNLFPASIAKDLPQLEYLAISRCGVEEIVSAGDGLEQPVRFEFPRVSSLALTNLTELKCFYPGQHTILWPMLKTLETACATLIKIIASEGFSIHDRREFIKGQSLFLGEEV